MTKLYFHEATSTVSGTLPSSTQSGLTITESVEAQSVNRTMDDNRGAGPQTSKAAVINQSTARTTYFTRFCSLPLKAGTVSANTWNYSFAAQQSATAMQFPTVTGTTNPVRICAYVWRPGTGAKVGDILNANSNSDFGSTAATTLKCTFGTFAGSAVTANAGDIICIEVIFLYTPTTGSKTGTYFYDGNTENTGDGIVVSNHATYIETPQTLSFSAVQRSATETASISDSAAIRVTPGPGHNANVLTKKMTLTLDATGTVHDQSFTGVGFQPKAMIVYGVLTTGSAYAEGYSAFYGFSDGASHNACVAVADVDNLTTYDCSNMVRNDACIDLLSTAAGNAELIRGVVKTFDSDGATITWNVKNTTQYIIHALFIGGTDITNVFVGQTTAGTTSTGAKGYTGVGFKPDIELFAAGSNVTVNTLTAGTAFSIGASVSSAKQFANAIKVMDAITAVSAQNAGVYFAAAQCLAATKLTASSTWDLRASFTSHDTDGFTLTHNTAPVASTFPFIFMCIKGGIWDVGTLTQRASSGLTTITPLVFADPEGLLLTITDDTTKDAINITNTASINVTIAIGACDNTAEGYIAFGDAYQASPCRTAMISSTTKLIRNITPVATATSSTTDSECDISDMATVGDLDINWTTADATARWIGYVLLQKGPIATGQNITKSLTETVTIGSGTLALLRNKTRTLSESVSVPGTLSRTTGKNRALSDTITIGTGTLTRVKGSVRTITETVTIGSGTLALLRNKIRTIVQTVSIGEALTRQSAKNRALSDTVTIGTGTLTRIKGSVKVITQTVSVSDTLSMLRSKIRTIVQTVSIGETPSRQTAKSRAISQTVTIADLVARAIGARTVVKSLTETVSISDILSILRKKNRAISQTVTVAETPTKSAGKNKAISQTVSVSDALTLIRNKIRTITQAISSSDSVAKSQSKNRAITQSVSVSDSSNRLTQKIRSLIESISVSDLANQTANKGIQHVVRIIDEARIVVSDAFYKVREIVEPTITISDFVGAQKTDNTPTAFSKNLTEFVSVGLDIVTKQASKSRTLQESSSLSTDSVAITHRGKARSNVENITVSDFVGCTKSQRQITKSLTESVSSTDSASIQRGKVRRIGGPG